MSGTTDQKTRKWMSRVSVRRRLLRGIVALFYGQAVIGVIQLAGVPILLHAWGARLYGEWLVLFALPSYLSMADLGFSLSAANDMTARYATGDRDGTLALFQSLAMLVYSAAGVGLILTSLLLWLLPLHRWIPEQGLSVNEIRWILELFAAEVLIKLTDGINHAGFRSHGEYGLHVTLTYSLLFIQYGAVWTVALLGGGLVRAAVVFLAVRAVVSPGITLWLLGRHSDLRLGFRYASIAKLRALVKPAVANVSTPLASAMNIQGMVIIVGAEMGPLAVVTFVTLRTLTRLVSQTAWRIAHAFEPELAAAWGAQDGRQLLRKLFEHSLRYGFWIAVFLLAGLVVFGSPILRLWTHGKVAMDVVLFYWLLLCSLTSVTWYAALNLLKSGNIHIRAAIAYVATATGALFLGLLLLHLTGRLYSVGIALLLMNCGMMIYLWRAVARVLSVKVLDLARAMLDLRSIIYLLLDRDRFHVAP